MDFFLLLSSCRIEIPFASFYNYVYIMCNFCYEVSRVSRYVVVAIVVVVIVVSVVVVFVYNNLFLDYLSDV